MKYLIAIDQSTSATKALLYDEQGRVLDRSSREHRQIYPQPGWVEHDLEEIWNNVLTVSRDLISRHPDKSDSIAFVSLTNQRETITVFEKGTGRPLAHAIVWQCRRGAPVCRELEEQGHGDLITQKTGLRLDTYFSASKLKWWVDQDVRLKKMLENGEALVGTIDTYLIYRLTQCQVFATDHTNASRTLLFDIGRCEWDEALCQLFSVPSGALPEVRHSSASFGATALGGSLPKAVPICGVMGDSQAALFAQRCYQPGNAKITFGTGSSVLLNLGHEFREPTGGCVTTIAWVMGGLPTYCLEGIINFSAASLEWLKNQLGILDDARDAGMLASEVRDNGGVYLIPAFAGLGAPHWKPDARAAIVGLTSHSNRNHIIRAAEESIAYQLRDVLAMMAGSAQVTLSGIQADGGPTRDAFLMQFTADILGIDLCVSSEADCSSLGAAMCGMLGTGMRSSLDDLTALPRESTVFSPSMAMNEVDDLVKGWHSAVSRVF